MKALLVRPKYHLRYPSLGFRKLSAYHKKQGTEVDCAENNDYAKWGLISYPMRYQPIKGKHALKKDSYIETNWTTEQLKITAKARRVIDYGSAFIPHDGFKKKFFTVITLEEAMELRPLQGK